MTKAILTGGGTGIDAATARALDAAGHSVIAVGLDRSDELPEAIPFVKLDLSDDGSVTEFFGALDGEVRVYRRERSKRW